MNKQEIIEIQNNNKISDKNKQIKIKLKNNAIERLQQNLTPEKSLEIEKNIYRTYSKFYTKIAWISNLGGHDKNKDNFHDFFKIKDSNMITAFTYGLMGELERIRYKTR